MKNILYILFFFSFICSFAQGKSVTIGKIIWASANVGATKANEHGSYFTWEEAQKACPGAWRLPTKEEFEKLSKISEWSSLDGISGRWYGRDKKKLFLSAAGYRFDGKENKFYDVNAAAGYWSGTQIDHSASYFLSFSSDSNTVGSTSKTTQFAVRCVK